MVGTWCYICSLCIHRKQIMSTDDKREKILDRSHHRKKKLRHPPSLSLSCINIHHHTKLIPSMSPPAGAQHPKYSSSFFMLLWTPEREIYPLKPSPLGTRRRQTGTHRKRCCKLWKSLVDLAPPNLLLFPVWWALSSGRLRSPLLLYM